MRGLRGADLARLSRQRTGGLWPVVTERRDSLCRGSLRPGGHVPENIGRDGCCLKRKHMHNSCETYYLIKVERVDDCNQMMTWLSTLNKRCSGEVTSLKLVETLKQAPCYLASRRATTRHMT